MNKEMQRKCPISTLATNVAVSKVSWPERSQPDNDPRGRTPTHNVIRQAPGPAPGVSEKAVTHKGALRNASKPTKLFMSL